MKILMVGPSRRGKGGISTVVNNYFESSFSSDFEVEYVPTAIDGAKLIKLIYWVYSFIKLLILFLIKDIKIVHIHMASRGSFYRKSKIVTLSKIFKKKVIIHLHGAQFDVFYNNECNDRKKYLVRRTFNSADRIIVLSEEWKSFVSSITKTRIDVLYNAVSINRLNVPNENNEINITFLGRLDKRKGIYDLIKASEALIKYNKNLKFNLAGDGELEVVKKKIKDLSIEGNIKILGWINQFEKEELLKNTKIYILPSYNEGMPMSILEAMSYGIPVISTYVGGIPSVIENDVNGILIRPGDINSLKDKINELILDKEKYSYISNNAYKTIKDNFSLERHVKILGNIYNSISGSSIKQ